MPAQRFGHLLLICLLFTTLLSASMIWDSVLNNYCITDIAEYDSGYWVATSSSGAFRFDRGTGEWTHYYAGNGKMSQSDDVNDMKIIRNKVWFATNYGLYRCNLNGSSWVHSTIGSDYFSNWVRDIDYAADTVWIASFTGLYTYDMVTRTFHSHDVSVSGHDKSSYIVSLSATDSLVWIGTEEGLIRYDRSASIDHASSRTYFGEESIFDGSDNVICRAVCAIDGGVYLGLEEYTSVNNPDYCLGGLFGLEQGEWQKYNDSDGLPANGVHFIEKYDDKLYIGLFHYIDGVNFNGAGLLEFNLNDHSWRQLDSLTWHIGNNQVRSFYCSNGDTLIGTEHGLYTNKDSLIGLPGTNVNNIDKEPCITLDQNYPNPFNPNTVISYSITRNDHVSLDIFDMHGKRVKCLKDGYQSAGYYRIEISSGDLPSGLYIYQLRSGNTKIQKKMLLIK
jgi:frataxin-like iron-binding protein CyaY